MKIKNFSIEIDNYDNAAMSEMQLQATISILEDCIKKIKWNDIEGETLLRDINGNKVGKMFVETE